MDHDAWVDNLVWLGSVQDLRAIMAELERLMIELNFAWSENPKLHVDSFVFVGLLFDLKKRCATTTGETNERMVKHLRVLGEEMTLRAALSIVGLVLWTNWALTRCPLAFLENLLSWLRTVCSEDSLRSLDDSLLIPVAVRLDLSCWI